MMRFEYVEAFQLERRSQQLAERPVVVDHEDLRLALHGVSLSFAAAVVFALCLGRSRAVLDSDKTAELCAVFRRNPLDSYDKAGNFTRLGDARYRLRNVRG
jgi:hypothetical protein